MGYEVGQKVTVLPPYERDPVLIAVCPHVIVSRERRGPMGELSYEVIAPWTVQVNRAGQPIRDRDGKTTPQVFGPFPIERLAPGWQG